MNLVGPDIFPLTVSPERCGVTYPAGGRTFSGRATSNMPKLYVVVTTQGIEYVGVTKQTLSRRIRLGWTATGDSGYYGYQWRNLITQGKLFVWYQDDSIDRSNKELETVEAEIVFLVRQGGQWPRGQTEIHFYPSSEKHREMARHIYDICQTDDA